MKKVILALLPFILLAAALPVFAQPRPGWRGGFHEPARRARHRGSDRRRRRRVAASGRNRLSHLHVGGIRKPAVKSCIPEQFGQSSVTGESIL